MFPIGRLYRESYFNREEPKKPPLGGFLYNLQTVHSVSQTGTQNGLSIHYFDVMY